MKALAVVFGVLLLSFPAFSQTANGRIGGAVKDQTGGAIVGATVTVTDVARGLSRNLTSDDAGIYSAPNLLPGNYTVRATFAGFQAFERQNIVLEVGQDLAIDAVLQPGAQTQTITVTEELPLVNTTSATLGGTLAPQQMTELPISGGNFQNLQQLQPGVVLQIANNSNGGGAASTNGIRGESSNEYLVEGLHVMDPYTGQSIINNIGVNGDADVILPVDAIQEFNMQFDPKAEYGFKAGGSVGVGLKSGTNNIHGTAIGLFRDTPWDSRSYFNVTSQPTKANGTMQQWGGTVGGPIKKDKLFFFLGYEQQNYTYGNPGSTTYGFTDPSLLSCSGQGTALFACNPIANSIAGNGAPDVTNDLMLACLAIPAANRSPQSLFIAGMKPNCEPNTAPGQSAAIGGVPSLVYPGYFVPHGATDHGANNAGNPTVTTYFPNAQISTLALGSLAKIDYQLNDKNSVNGFFFKGYGSDDDCQTCVNPLFKTTYKYYAQVEAGSWTYLPNAVMANSFRFGHAMLNSPDDSDDSLTGITAAQLGIPTGIGINTTAGGNFTSCNCVGAGYPQITAGAFGGFLGGRMNERQGPESSIEINDQMSYLAGKHSLKYGVDFIAEHTSGGIYTNDKGAFTFGSAPGFFAGLNPVPQVGQLVSSASNGLTSESNLFGNPIIGVRRNTWSLFVQDDFRIKPRLTLNLGVRWQYTGDMSEDNNLLASFDPIRGMTQIGITTNRLFPPYKKAFSPRLGFAYDVFGNGKTVVRAGGSMIYELVTMRTFLDPNTNIGNDPTGFVIGCSTALTPAVGLNNVAANQASNCPGQLITSGGTSTAAVNTFSAANGDLNAITWDGPANGSSSSILPVATTVPGNCNASIFTAAPGITAAQPGVPGGACPILFVNPHFRTPYVEGWNFSLQQAIRNNVVVTIAYVGNHGVGLVGTTNINQPFPNIPGVGWNALETAGPNAGLTLAQICNNVGGNAAANAAAANVAVGTITSACNPASLDSKAANVVANVPGFGNVSAKSLYQDTVLNAQQFQSKFPYLGNISELTNRDVSNFDSLQESLTIRNYHGLSAVAGYTWGHSLGIGNNNTDTASGGLAYNITTYNYGPQGQDVRHRITFAPTYDIPGSKRFDGVLEGWKVSSTYIWQTGTPITPSGATDTTGVGGDRWNIFGGGTGFVANLGGQGSTPAAASLYPNFFPGGTSLPVGNNPRTGVPYVAADMAVNNPTCVAHAASVATLAAFGCWTDGGSIMTPPALDTYGNMGVGMLRGPHFWQLDMSLTKTQKITERFSVQFRSEFYNILNHPNLSAPSFSVATCVPGTCGTYQINNTPNVSATNSLIGNGGPRRILLGVKILF